MSNFEWTKFGDQEVVFRPDDGIILGSVYEQIASTIFFSGAPFYRAQTEKGDMLTGRFVTKDYAKAALERHLSPAPEETAPAAHTTESKYGWCEWHPSYYLFSSGTGRVLGYVTYEQYRGFYSIWGRDLTVKGDYEILGAAKEALERHLSEAGAKKEKEA